MKQTVRFFDYPLQFKVHEKEYREILLDTLSRGAFLLGEDTRRFEESLARFVGTKYAIGVGNCTDAILLSLIAAGIGPGDEVISVSHTFVATIEVMKFVGATPIFIDITDDHNMNVDLIEAAITAKTKAIVPVHLNGTICKKMDTLVQIAQQRGLTVIEDAAQSLGATYRGKGAGSFGIAGCFSFYPAKLLGAFGDAGAVVTSDETFAERVRMLRNHGRGQGTDINIWGLNCRMDNIHAAILDHKLKKLPEWITRRREIAKLYHDGLSSVKELKLPASPGSNSEHYDVFQNYEIEAESRDDLLTHLREHGVEFNLPWGGKAVHQFQGLDIDKFSLPRTNDLFRKMVMLPLYPELSNGQIETVMDVVKGFYRTGNTQ